MKKTLIDGNASAAWGARLSKVEVAPVFPITPQTEVIETLAEWKCKKLWNGEFVQLEGEHSVLTAAIASQATGARTFTASSSQGLLYMHEMHYVASGMRLPLVMVNCSRALSAPISLWCDNNDILAIRDSGWLMFFAKNNQEVLDSIIMAYKISENRDVLLPSIINMDGFIHSYTREPVCIPEQGCVDRFLPKYEPKTILDPKKPMSLGTPVIPEYMYFRSQHHKASMNALKVIPKVCKEFEKAFGRKYGLIEKYKCDDAKIIFVALGSLCTTIEEAVNDLRKEGMKVGLLRIRVLRPFPKDEIKKALKGKHIAVIDNNVAPGYGGILYPEICSVVGTENVSDFIVGLGGKNVSKNDFKEIAKTAMKKHDIYWDL